MTSWIVAIANTHPQHWKIAAHHGFWDMTRRVDIQRGDTVYFWLTRGSLVSKTTATSDARTITGADALPWEDSGVRSYTTRFHFVVTSDQPMAQPSWSVVARSAGARAGLNFGPQRIDSPEGEAYLADQFPSSSVPPVDIEIDETLRVEVESLLVEDLRERAQRTIALRQGQPAFRNALLTAYQGTCCVTGYRTESVLEAAHISPYKGHHTNDVTNGLLLRADIHTLFDRYLITVTADLKVRVAPSLSGTPYMNLNNERMAVVPAVHGQRPAVAALAAHHQLCPWYVEGIDRAGDPQGAELGYGAR